MMHVKLLLSIDTKVSYLEAASNQSHMHAAYPFLRCSMLVRGVVMPPAMNEQPQPLCLNTYLSCRAFLVGGHPP